MTDIIVAFITGLTTGGLSCLAIQGGLLASSLANQIEQDVKDSDRVRRSIQVHIAQPIFWFLLAKVFAYTIVGFLLGVLGSVFQLSAIARAILQLGIGIFMVGSALRMLNVHPIFRYFAFEPPAFITRYIRRTAKNNVSVFTPAFLGLLTVLIPCGVTQIMMATAIASSDPVKGAALMFAFTLGTTPLFFTVAYFATRLGATLEKSFIKVVAVIVLLLGLFTINTGLNLAGSPYSVDNLVSSLRTAQVAANQSQVEQACSDVGECEQRGIPVKPYDTQPNSPLLNPVGPLKLSATPIPQADPEVLTVYIRNRGYEPDVLHAKMGVPVQLKLVSEDTYSCSLSFEIPALGVHATLQPTDVETIMIPPQSAGSILRFTCSMGMYAGRIYFDL